MNLKNIYLLLGLSLIFLFISYHIYINNNDYKDSLEQELIIDKVFNYSDEPLILGYLEIPNYNIKRLIKKGTDKQILDDGYIGLLDGSSIDDGNTVLAGHNINNIFKILHKVKRNDKVIIKTYNDKYEYYVTEKRKISSTDFSYFENSSNKTLTLITCTDKKDERLIVRLNLIK